MVHPLFTRLGLAVSAAVLIASLGASGAMAGEITGNGKPLWTSTTTIVNGCGPGCNLVFHTLHGRSECAFSGQEDAQFVDPFGVPLTTVVKGVPTHAQSWGQIPKATRDFLTNVLHVNPGIACNPTKAGAE